MNSGCLSGESHPWLRNALQAVKLSQPGTRQFHIDNPVHFMRLHAPIVVGSPERQLAVSSDRYQPPGV